MAKDKNRNKGGSKSYRESVNALADEFDAAEKRYAEIRDSHEKTVTEGGTLTDEQRAERVAAQEERDAVYERLTEMRDEHARKRAVAEARRDAGLDFDGDVKVTNEPRTYGPGSPYSYFADFVRSQSPQWKGHDEARGRLAKHATEVSHALREDPTSPEGLRARSSVQNTYRENGSRAADSAIDELRTRADAEVRTGMDTGSTSGGSFVTPQYFVSDYAPYRQFGRIFIDAANKQALPDYGMEVYIPSVSNAAGVASQSSQNTGIDEADPTALYLSAALNTLAGQVTVSQQLLDRAGPNFAFDKMVFDQLNRAYCVAVDQYVLTQAIATAGVVTATATSFTQSGAVSSTNPFFAPYAFQKVGQAKAATVDAAGTVLPATHAFFTPARWEFISTETGANGNALVQPNYAGVFQAIAAGSSGQPIAEGDTGYSLSGLKVFEDGNIPNQATGGEDVGADQTIVAHMPEVWVWEGDLVPRTIPQTYAQDLSVLLQLYAYVTCIVRYPLAVQTIQWNQTATSLFPA